MKKKYHYLWIAEAGGKLVLDFGDVKQAEYLVPEKTRTRRPTPASRARLQRALRELTPTMVYMHPEGPSITYYIKRGTQFTAPRAAMLNLKVA